MKKKMIIITIVTLLVITIVSVVGFKIYSEKNKEQQVADFNEYFIDVREEFNNLIVNDYQSEYNKILDECNTVITSKDVGKIDAMKKYLSSLEEKVSNENESNLKSSLKEIKKIDLSDYEDKDSIEEDISEVDGLINDKKYKSALDKIDDISIKIEKNRNKLEEVKKQKAEEQKAIQEAIAKAESIKVASNIASRDNVENLIRNYLKSFSNAVNNGNFDTISKYIYPDSPLYNEQKLAVKSWYDQGIKEKFLGFTAKDITFSDDKLEGTIISEEVFEITNPSSGTRTETFNWLYKFKYNTAIENYQIIEIANP